MKSYISLRFLEDAKTQRSKSSVQKTQTAQEDLVDLEEFFKNYESYNRFLFYGEVQSGKTQKILYIIKKLFSIKKIMGVIYLTGTKNNLLEQNQTRVFNEFDKKNIAMYQNDS